MIIVIEIVIPDDLDLTREVVILGHRLPDNVYKHDYVIYQPGVNLDIHLLSLQVFHDSLVPLKYHYIDEVTPEGVILSEFADYQNSPEWDPDSITISIEEARQHTPANSTVGEISQAGHAMLLTEILIQ